ncbi:MAG: PGN_0703 family putative restriction endonuclease [Thermodesulfobacteriota bacterium]
MKNIKDKAYLAIRDRFVHTTDSEIDSKGYVRNIEDNLLPGITTSLFKTDLEAGSGNELENKFKAVHSSSALVINCFAPWKKKPRDLIIDGIKGFDRITFEKQCPTGLGGTPPNLDLVLENKSQVIGVESKFTEYLTPKKPQFAASYNKNNLPQAEDKWMDLIERLRENSSEQYLDAAQLVKHYLGLRKQYADREITLLYLFWEPENWQEYDEFQAHRKEFESFSNQVADTSVQFIAQSYSSLWDDWHKRGLDPAHLSWLRGRYSLPI